MLMVSGGGFRVVVVVEVWGIDWVGTVRSFVGDNGEGKSRVSARKLLRSGERRGGRMM